MAQLFSLPRQLLLNASLAAVAGAKANFYLTGTTTRTNTYTTSALSVAHANPVVADAAGVFPAVWMDPTVSYKVVITTAADVTIYTEDPITEALTQAQLGAIFYPRTTAETNAGVTPTNYAYAPGDVRRYGAVGDGTTDDTTAIQRAINVTDAVHFYDGDYRAVGLTGSTNLQRFIAHGDVSLRKNGNGVILAHSGTDVVLEGIQFRGESASFTGNNLNLTGERPTLVNCSSRDAAALAVLATKNRVRILGSCDIYQTAATGAGDYDIEIGTSGTATLYHVLEGFNSSQSTGGIRFIDCGGQSVIGCQFGKLFVDAGTSPAGVNGGMYAGNRILGNTTVEISNSAFSANQIGAITLTFATGTSGHAFDRSNVIDASATITDNSTNSSIVDLRDCHPRTYTPTWTAASSAPALGNGTITGFWSKVGRRVRVTIDLQWGSTTTGGTGAWFFSLPFVPSTAIAQYGNGQIFDNGTALLVGVPFTLTDGTARSSVFGDADASEVTATVPITWTTSDRLRFTLEYET